MTRLRHPLLNYYRYRGARFKPLRHPASGISSKPIDFEKISQHIGPCQEKKSIYGILNRYRFRYRCLGCAGLS